MGLDIFIHKQILYLGYDFCYIFYNLLVIYKLLLVILHYNKILDFLDNETQATILWLINIYLLDCSNQDQGNLICYLSLFFYLTLEIVALPMLTLFYIDLGKDIINIFVNNFYSSSFSKKEMLVFYLKINLLVYS